MAYPVDFRPEMRVLFAVEVVLYIPSKPGDSGTERAMHIAPIIGERFVRHFWTTKDGRVGVDRYGGIARRKIRVVR